MRTITKFVTRLRGSADQSSTHDGDFYREWDRALAAASSPSERSEIDAIFSRHLV